MSTPAVREMLAAGFSYDEIKIDAAQQHKQLLSAGFSQEEADTDIHARYGMRLSYDSSMEQDLPLVTEALDTPENATELLAQEEARAVKEIARIAAKPATSTDATSIRSATEEEKQAGAHIPIKQTKNAVDAFVHGFQYSTTGLFFAGAPTLAMAENASLSHKAISMLAQGVGDLPSTVAGGIIGGAATATTGPGALAGAFAGAMATNEALRATLMMNYERGSVDTVEEFIHRLGVVATVAGKSGATGYMTGYAGGLAGTATAGKATSIFEKAIQATAQPAVEVATMTAANAADSQHLPKWEDFLLGGIMVGGYRLGGFYTNKLAYNFIKSADAPRTLLHKMASSLAVKEDMLSSNIQTPREQGGNILYLYGVKSSVGDVVSGKEWVHLSPNRAHLITDKLNAKAGEEAGMGYQVENMGIPADLPMLYIKGRNDPDKLRVYKQFLTHVGKDPKEVKDIGKLSQEMMENPTPEFISFLRGGGVKIGKGSTVDLGPVEGLRLGDKVLLFDQSKVLRGHALDIEMKPMPISAAEIGDSVSVGESSSKNASEAAQASYQAIIDRLQPLNKVAPTGQMTLPYLAARLYAGSNGIVRHWLTVNRTTFASLKSLDNTRNPAGKSLKEILETGKARFDPDKSTIAAFDALAKGIQDAENLKVPEALSALNELKAQGHLKDVDLNTIHTRLLEQNQALSNRADPLNMFRVYLVAKRASDLIERNMETGLDPAAVKSIATNPAWEARFGQAAKDLYVYQRALLDYKHKAGLISKKALANMVLENPHYIPFNRVIEGVDPKGLGVYKVKGSEKGIIDPFESIIYQTQAVIRAAERNETARIIAEAYGTTDPKATRSITYAVKGRPHTVKVMDDIWQAVEHLDPVSARLSFPLFNAASHIAGWLRAGAVLHPAFGIKNVVRDQFAAYVNSDSGYKPFLDFGKGLAAVISQKTGKQIFPNAAEYFNEWARHGGSMGNLVSMDRNYTQETAQTLLNTSNVHNSVPFSLRALDNLKVVLNPINWGRKTYRALQNISESSDEATRLGEYIRARAQGTSPFEAALRSREVVIDFNRMGASMRALNSMSAFLNARIQGADKSIRQLTAQPVRTVNRIMSGIVLPSILLGMVQQDIIHQSPDSDLANALREIPDWQKNMFWIIPTHAGIFRVPVPQEYGIPFANPARLFVEYMYDKSPNKDFLTTLMESGAVEETLGSYFLSIDDILGAVTPSMIQPLGEVANNRNLFSGSPVIPPSLEGVLPEIRYNRNTTELAKGIGQLLKHIDPAVDKPMIQRLRSPIVIDYLIQGYSGSVGKELWQLLDSAAQKAGIVDKVNKPAMTVEELPIIKAFMVKYPSVSSQSVEKFYKEAEIADRRWETLRLLRKEGSPKAFQNIEEMELMNIQLPRLMQVREFLGSMRTAIMQVHFNPDLHPEDKREQIETMYLHTYTAAQQGLQILTDLKKAAREAQQE